VSRGSEALRAAGWGAVGAMAMTGMRRVTTKLGLLERTPPRVARLLSLSRLLCSADVRDLLRPVVGFLACLREHTVTGILVAAQRERVWHHSRAHDFVARARWSPDELGLRMLAFLLERFLPAGAPLVLAEERRTLSCLFDRSTRPHRSPPMLPPATQARICAGDAVPAWEAPDRRPVLATPHETVWTGTSRASASISSGSNPEPHRGRARCSRRCRTRTSASTTAMPATRSPRSAPPASASGFR
jgi:DDE superfamily endonuclease